MVSAGQVTGYCTAVLLAFDPLVAANAGAQPRFLERCGAYAGTQTTVEARPFAKALCRCYAEKIRAAKDIPTRDKSRLLSVRPGPGGRVSVAAIRAMERINRECWRAVRKKPTR